MLKPCRVCHRALPPSNFQRNRRNKDGLQTDCRDCRKAFREANHESEIARTRAWSEKNREYVRAKRREYHKQNAEKLRAKTRAWVKANKARKKAMDLAYRMKNTPRVNERSRLWCAANPDKRRQVCQKWRCANLQKVTEFASRRRSRQMNAPIVEEIDRELIIFRDEGICYLCGAAVATNEISLDHVIPLARGGNHSAENLRLAHRRCNSKKNAKLLSELDLTTFAALEAEAA